MEPCSAFQFVGIGLRTPHLGYFEQHPNQVGWFEIHSENYFLNHTHEYQQLKHIRQHSEISCHGIGLSLGSVNSVNKQHLTKLNQLISDIHPFAVSDHLSWSEHGGHYFNDLLPLPYTEEALAVFCRNVLQVQDAIKRPLLIENPSSYLRFEHSTIPEWEFLSEVQKQTDCRLLLDLNNIHVSCFNHHYDPMRYINAIDPKVVDEIHLAGFTRKSLPQGEIWIDTHSTFVSDEVWDLYRHWNGVSSPTPTLIEWDIDIPEPQVLLAEAQKAIDIIIQENSNSLRSA